MLSKVKLSILLFCLCLFLSALSYSVLAQKAASPDAKPAAASTDASVAKAADGGNCLACHSQLTGRLNTSAATWAADTHSNVGVSCTGCHNGNSSAGITMANFKEAHASVKNAAGKEVSFIGKPTGKEQVALCGSCHENGEGMRTFKKTAPDHINDVYLASKHGQALSAYAADKAEKTAKCASCHGHIGEMSSKKSTSLTYPKNIATTCGSCHASEAYMTPFLKDGDVFTNHIESYMKSIHADALHNRNQLGAPTCNTCHGTHGDKPEKLASVADACGSCHAGNLEFFTRGPHQKAWSQPDYVGNKQCMGCHGGQFGHEVVHYADNKIGSSDEAVCVGCHNPQATPDDKMYPHNRVALGSASIIHATLTDLTEKYDRSLKTLRHLEEKGVYVKDEVESMGDVKRGIQQCRTYSHFAWADSFKVVAKETVTLADSLDRKAATLEAGFDSRRTLFIIVGILVGLLVIGLSAIAAKMRD